MAKVRDLFAMITAVLYVISLEKRDDNSSDVIQVKVAMASNRDLSGVWQIWVFRAYLKLI